MNILHRIREAVHECLRLTTKPPRAIYLGEYLYNEFEHHPEVHDARRYSVENSPIHQKPILWEGVQIIEVLRSPKHFGVEPTQL